MDRSHTSLTMNTYSPVIPALEKGEADRMAPLLMRVK
jgi:hypothetical protein